MVQGSWVFARFGKRKEGKRKPMWADCDTIQLGFGLWYKEAGYSLALEKEKKAKNQRGQIGIAKILRGASALIVTTRFESP